METYLYGAPDSKLVLRLSDSIWQLLEKDRQYFSLDVRRKLSLSGLISRLVRHDWEKNHALRFQPPRAEKPATLRRVNLSKELADFVDSETELQLALQQAGTSLSQWTAALLTEYVTLDYTHREQLCFYPIYHRTVELLPLNKPFRLKIATPEGSRTLPLIPLRWVNGQELPYNYLIGYDPVEQRNRATRLTRILGVSTTGGRGLTAAQRENLEEELRTKNTAFLGEQELKILARFTPQGLQLLGRILINRPPFEFPDAGEEGLVCFHATENQAFAYLNRFGADGVVLEPESLRERLRAYYRAAAEAYNAGF